MPDEHRNQLHADRAVIEQAATAQRQRSISEQYDGAEQRGVVFGLALMLDELSLHVRDVSDEVRSGAVRCSQLLSRPTS